MRNQTTSFKSYIIKRQKKANKNLHWLDPRTKAALVLKSYASADINDSDSLVLFLIRMVIMKVHILASLVCTSKMLVGFEFIEVRNIY